MPRPLIVSDCDGVLMNFIDPFIAYLADEHGLTLRMTSFALSGNIHDAEGNPVPGERFPALLDGFFTTHMHTQTPTDGAVAALADLAQDCDIVVLTNIGDRHAVTRTVELEKVGMPYRVIGNLGPKGGPLAGIVAGFQPSLAVFVDDLPPHISSARKLAPDVHCLHMVAEPPLQDLIPPAPDAHARIDSWAEAHAHIRRLIEELA